MLWQVLEAHNGNIEALIAMVGDDSTPIVVCWMDHPLVESSCGYNSGQIEPLVAPYMESLRNVRNTAIKQHAQLVAHGQQRPDRCPRLILLGCINQAPPSTLGQPWGHTPQETRHHPFRVPHDVWSTGRSSFRLLVMASPHEMLVGTY